MKLNSNHKAVAPIIATLLMVAIAVVGGILIFVFTQGFFADEQVVGPTVDNIRIFGYNATESADRVIGSADDTVFDCYGNGFTNNPAADNVLDDGECFTVFIENLGDKPVAIQDVRVFGESYTLTDNLGGDCPEPDGDEGEFGIIDHTGTPNGYGHSDGSQLSIIEPNTEATICITYDDTNTNEIKVGRTIPVQVETANGQSSQINIIMGAVRGQR